MLRGRSVIDWHRLGFPDLNAVDRFLRINEFDPDSREDMARLDELRDEAIDYLVRQFSFPLSEDVATAPARDLLLLASRDGNLQRSACVVLKVMHIVHHLAGRELMVRLPISDDAVFHAVELKVMQVVEELRASGFPIEEFAWSRKPRDSLITKLLAKRSTLAAQIYDKLRFRLIVPKHSDLVPVLTALTRQVVPFNYVIPGATVNHLVSLEDTIATHERLKSLEHALQPEPTDNGELPEKLNAPLNEFSAAAYRIINFVADLPVRVDSIVPAEELPADSGHVVFVMAEFQLADRRTAEINETGESRHDAYKSRQRARVRSRLENGSE